MSGAESTTAAVDLRPLPDISATEWDQTVATYPDATVFHLACWHECLERSLPGSVIRFEIVVDGEVCGHWCGFLLKKFGARIFGAPLPGSATDYMYPLLSREVPAGLILRAVRHWAKQRRIGMVDVGGEYFCEADLTANGFKARYAQTYRVDISHGADEVFKQLKPAMRNKIRKAEKSGVVVTHDTSPEFPGRFFAMLEAVFERQGMVPTYGLDRVEAVVQALAPGGNVVPLTAWRDDQALASIIVLADARAAYFWGGASYGSAYPYGANDIIHWHALQLAVKRGLTVYDTCGGGDYKTKFGGQLIMLPAGHINLNPVFAVVRATVQRGVRARSKLLVRARRAGNGTG